MLINEDNFIEKLKKNKTKALDYVIDKYAPLVKGISTKILYSLRNSGLIEECISDVFIAVWKNSKRFKGDKTSFKKWIAAITKYKAIDYYRKNINSINVENIEDYNIKSSKDLEDEVINSDNEKTILKLIENLDEINKKIFTMKFLLGMTTNEISKNLNLSTTAIDNRIFRERKKLKKQFSKIQGEVI